MDFHTFAAGDRPIRRAGLPRSRLAAGLALALLGLASGRAHAKAELRIVVVDSLTSLPVQGAAVELRTQAGDALWRGSSDAGETGFGNFAMAAVHLALDEREQALQRFERVYRLRHAKVPHFRQWSASSPSTMIPTSSASCARPDSSRPIFGPRHPVPSADAATPVRRRARTP